MWALRQLRVIFRERMEVMEVMKVIELKKNQTYARLTEKLRGNGMKGAWFASEQ